MSLTTQSMNPVMTPSLLYPSYGKLKPYKKHYRCVRCEQDNRSRLQVEIVRKSEIVFGFMCDSCHKRWYISSKLILNEVLEEHFQKIHKFCMTTKKEFGALLVKTAEGIRMDMLDIGEDLSVSFKKTKEYIKGETIVGSVHSHPITDEFSVWDIATFLRDDWEKISVVVGAEGSINVMIKLPETLKLTDETINQWLMDNKDTSLIEKANSCRFMLFKGKVNNLKLLAGKSDLPITTLERLLRYIE